MHCCTELREHVVPKNEKKTNSSSFYNHHRPLDCRRRRKRLLTWMGPPPPSPHLVESRHSRKICLKLWMKLSKRKSTSSQPKIVRTQTSQVPSYSSVPFPQKNSTHTKSVSLLGPDDPEDMDCRPSKDIMAELSDANFRPTFHSDSPFGITAEGWQALGSLQDIGIDLDFHQRLLAEHALV